MAFFTLFLTAFGLFSIFIQGKEEPVIALITIFAFLWTLYEFFKPEEENWLAKQTAGKPSMNGRDWIEMIALAVCFIWILAASGLS